MAFRKGVGVAVQAVQEEEEGDLSPTVAAFVRGQNSSLRLTCGCLVLAWALPVRASQVRQEQEEEYPFLRPEIGEYR